MTTVPKAALTVIVAVQTLCASLGQGAHFMMSHGMRGGGHILNMHQFSARLIERGHMVTTVTLADARHPKLENLGPNHTLFPITIDDTDGDVPYSAKDPLSQLLLPQGGQWRTGRDRFKLGSWLYSPKAWKLTERYCLALWGHLGLKKHFETNKVHVVVTDMLFNECSFIHAHVLAASTIGYVTQSMAVYPAQTMSLSTAHPYVPLTLVSSAYEMSLLDRVTSVVTRGLAWTTGCLFLWNVDLTAGRFFNSSSLPSTHQLIRNMHGALINSDLVWDVPIAMPPAFINVGGHHLQDEAKKLPKQLHQFVSTAPNGVIIVSFGIWLDEGSIPKSLMETLVQAFSRLPQRVIIEVSDSSVVDAHDNLLATHFLPQQDLLAQPNVRLFVSHCDSYGVMEAIYHAVPMVGLPIFLDHVDVCAKMKFRGMGEVLTEVFDSEAMYQTIVNVRDGPEYRNNVQALSRHMRITRHRPLDDAIQLLEYVYESGGANHMLLPSRNLNVMQESSLDVVAFVAASVLLGLKVTWRLLSWFLAVVRHVRKYKRD